MKRIFVTMLGVVLLVFVSCSYNQMVEKLAPKEESEYGKRVLEAIRTNDFATVSKALNQSISAQVTKEKLEEIAQYFPSEKLMDIEIIGSQVQKVNNDWNGTFTFEYKYENSKWALADIIVNKNNNIFSVNGFHIYLTENSQKEINRFTLHGKGVMNYLVLLFSVLIPIFSIFTLIVCIRTPFKKKKVLWSVFTLLGVTSIAVNWTTGQLSFQLLAVKLLSASAIAASPYSPWFISFSIPIGAILFWIKRGEIKKEPVDNTSNSDRDV